MVFTIIVTYNGSAWIRKALQSIIKQSEVIVIDNASTDNTIAIIEEEFSEVTLLKKNKNLGFGQANNLGIAMALKAGASYIFLMNQDVYVLPQAINILREAIVNINDIGVCSPLHYDGNGKKLDRLFNSYISGNKDLVKGISNNHFDQNLYNVGFINAAAWFMKSEVFEKIGGFDPIFFHYGEDENFIQRLYYNNYKTVVAPKAVIIHDRQDRKQIKEDLFSNNYIKKWEKHLKVTYANPNIKCDLKKRATKEKYKFYKLCIKFFIRGDFKRGKRYWSLKTKVKPLFDEIRISKNLSKSHKDFYL